MGRPYKRGEHGEKRFDVKHQEGMAVGGRSSIITFAHECQEAEYAGARAER